MPVRLARWFVASLTPVAISSIPHRHMEVDSPSNSSENSFIPTSVETTSSSPLRRDSSSKAIRESLIPHVVRCCGTSKGPCAVFIPITSISGRFMPGEMPPLRKPARHLTTP